MERHGVVLIVRKIDISMRSIRDSVEASNFGCLVGHVQVSQSRSNAPEFVELYVLLAELAGEYLVVIPLCEFVWVLQLS